MCLARKIGSRATAGSASARMKMQLGLSAKGAPNRPGHGNATHIRDLETCTSMHRKAGEDARLSFTDRSLLCCCLETDHHAIMERLFCSNEDACSTHQQVNNTNRRPSRMCFGARAIWQDKTRKDLRIIGHGDVCALMRSRYPA